MGYVNFTPACLVGPVYEYVDYEMYLNREGDYTSIPNTFNPLVKETGIFLFSLGLYFAMAMFPLDYFLSDEFMKYNLIYRLLYGVLAITHIELKYISAWSLLMISMRASGITYNPKKNITAADGTIKTYNFSKIEVNNMTEFYLNPSFKVKVDHWNISVAWALRRYHFSNSAISMKT